MNYSANQSILQSVTRPSVCLICHVLYLNDLKTAKDRVNSLLCPDIYAVITDRGKKYIL